VSWIRFEQIGYDAEGEPQYGVREVVAVTRVLHTTRKQPLIKEISDLVGYTKRIVHVIPCDSVRLLETQWSGVTRVRYRAVNIGTMEMIGLPQREGADVRLHTGMAIVASTVYDGREQPLTIYLRSENVRPNWASINPTDLSWEERVVLCATKAYQSTSRIAQAHNIAALGEAEYSLARHRLQEIGLLDSKGAITLTGLNTIGATTLHELALERQDPTSPHNEDT
jgi:hypothetical protein